MSPPHFTISSPWSSRCPVKNRRSRSFLQIADAVFFYGQKRADLVRGVKSAAAIRMRNFSKNMDKAKPTFSPRSRLLCSGQFAEAEEHEHPFKVMVVDKTVVVVADGGDSTVVVVGTTEGAMARRPPIVDVGSTESDKSSRLLGRRYGCGRAWTIAADAVERVVDEADVTVGVVPQVVGRTTSRENDNAPNEGRWGRRRRDGVRDDEDQDADVEEGEGGGGAEERTNRNSCTLPPSRPPPALLVELSSLLRYCTVGFSPDLRAITSHTYTVAVLIPSVLFHVHCLAHIVLCVSDPDTRYVSDTRAQTR
ncbi:hypothetical protein B0H14DRAFT_2631770 [Mycena olivaceomarginata]|nr:hypothetical protein B0H14DRAFT_2631770 [Mycena olivaceomarginata]